METPESNLIVQSIMKDLLEAQKQIERRERQRRIRSLMVQALLHDMHDLARQAMNEIQTLQRFHVKPPESD